MLGLMLLQGGVRVRRVFVLLIHGPELGAVGPEGVHAVDAQRGGGRRVVVVVLLLLLLLLRALALAQTY